VLHTSVRPIAMFIPPPPFQCLPSKQSLMQGKRKRARKKIALSGGKGDEQSEKMDDFDEMSMILNHTRMEEPLSHADLEPKYPYASGLMFLDPWLQQCNSQSIRMVCWVVRELQANKLSIPERVVRCLLVCMLDDRLSGHASLAVLKTLRAVHSQNPSLWLPRSSDFHLLSLRHSIVDISVIASVWEPHLGQSENASENLSPTSREKMQSAVGKRCFCSSL